MLTQGQPAVPTGGWPALVGEAYWPVAHIGTQKGNTSLIAALAGGATVKAAAKSAGLGRRTAYRRLEDPDFRRRVAEARREMLARAVGTLADASTAAAAKLRDLLDAESETVRLGACRAILELGAKLRESDELAERIAALEERLAAAGPGQNGRRVWSR